VELIKCLDEHTAIPWWNEERKIANQAIIAYNKWQLGEIENKEAYVIFALSYTQLSSDVDYSKEFNIMRNHFEVAGFDVSFYKGF